MLKYVKVLKEDDCFVFAVKSHIHNLLVCFSLREMHFLKKPG